MSDEKLRQDLASLREHLRAVRDAGRKGDKDAVIRHVEHADAALDRVHLDLSLLLREPDA